MNVNQVLIEVPMEQKREIKSNAEEKWLKTANNALLAQERNVLRSYLTAQF